jgi:hypothetical protein
MKKGVLLAIVGFLLIAWSGAANAATPPTETYTVNSVHTTTDYRGTSFPITVTEEKHILVRALFTKEKGRCIKGAVPGVRTETVDGGIYPFLYKERTTTPPTGGLPNEVVVSIDVIPGTYVFIPFYSCKASSIMNIYVY